MRPKYYLALLFLILTVLLVAASLPPRAKPPPISSFDIRDAPVESAEVQAEAVAPISITIEPDASETAPQPDGPSVLESHCTRCHLAHWIEGTKKSRPEWEETLARMESSGVLLSEAEKGILLEYLAITDEP